MRFKSFLTLFSVVLVAAVMAFSLASLVKAHPPAPDAVAMQAAQDEQSPTLIPLTRAHSEWMVQAVHVPHSYAPTSQPALFDDGQQLRRRDLERVGSRAFYRIE